MSRSYIKHKFMRSGTESKIASVSKESFLIIPPRLQCYFRILVMWTLLEGFLHETAIFVSTTSLWGNYINSFGRFPSQFSLTYTYLSIHIPREWTVAEYFLKQTLHLFLLYWNDVCWLLYSFILGSFTNIIVPYKPSNIESETCFTSLIYLTTIVL